MSKPVRYLLLLIVSAAAVCLVATAAGYYLVGPGGSFHWELDNSSGDTLFDIHSYRDTVLEIYGHRVHLPLPFMGGVLLGMLTGAAVCCWGAIILMRPLFAGQTAEPELPGEKS